MKARIVIFTVLSMLFPLLQLYCTSEEPRNGVYEKQGKISFPEGTPSIGLFHVDFELVFQCCWCATHLLICKLVGKILFLIQKMSKLLL